MHVKGLVDAFEDAVQGLEVGIVLPAVHVLGIQVKDSFVELVGHVASDTGLAHARGPVEERSFALVASGYRVESGGETVDFRRAVYDVSRDEFGLQDPRIAYHT